MKKIRWHKNRIKQILNASIVFLIITSFTGCDIVSNNDNALSASLDDIPPFTDEAYVEINDNVPEFTNEEKLTADSFEIYSDLDQHGRCGTAFANISQDTMPTEDREGIGMIKPSGWQTVRYDDLITDKYLYNRCHLIGFQLAGENANKKNLITGTRYLNIEGMLPFENAVAAYVKSTGNHVLYKVTPVFYEDELLARGVQIEAYSVEDHGNGISFNVYCYNNQPGITINYLTGESRRSVTSGKNETSLSEYAETTYILNTNTGKFHIPECSSVSNMKNKNKKRFTGTRAETINQGYEPCGICRP